MLSIMSGHTSTLLCMKAWEVYTANRPADNAWVIFAGKDTPSKEKTEIIKWIIWDMNGKLDKVNMHKMKSNFERLRLTRVVFGQKKWYKSAARILILDSRKNNYHIS